jgi:hypothetical protein
MDRGDHIFCGRVGYQHHGIYCGDNKVIHYSGEKLAKENAFIRISSLCEFSSGKTVRVRQYDVRHNPDETINRAESRLGDAEYDLISNNCEHFARWCITGDHCSEQIRDAVATAGGTAGAGVATAGAVGAVVATGAAAGLSGGAGIMSGAAAIGGIVGGGAIVGLAALGAAPAVGVGVAANHVFADDTKLTRAERNARKAGRVATYAGGAAGTAGAIGAISACGSVAGLSGAGITSGLAAIGLGGGMLAGTAIVVAAPAVLAAITGYAFYRLWK